MAKHGIIRTIYLYLFALVGLIMIVFGGYRLVDVGLRTYVFTKVDYGNCRIYTPEPIERKIVTEDYEVDENCVTAQRQRDMVGGLAGLLVGVPLWLYHWRVIRRDVKRG